MIDPPLQWQVVRVELDPTRGSEQAGIRPCLVISRESINSVLSVMTVLPITTRRSGSRGYSTEVLLPQGTAGLTQDSIAMAQQIRVISKDRLLGSFGRLEDEALISQVRTAVRTYLELE